MQFKLNKLNNSQFSSNKNETVSQFSSVKIITKLKNSLPEFSVEIQTVFSVSFLINFFPVKSVNSQFAIFLNNSPVESSNFQVPIFNLFPIHNRCPFLPAIFTILSEILPQSNSVACLMSPKGRNGNISDFCRTRLRFVPINGTLRSLCPLCSWSKFFPFLFYPFIFVLK